MIPVSFVACEPRDFPAKDDADMAQSHICCQLCKVIPAFFAGRRLSQIPIQDHDTRLRPPQALSAFDQCSLIALALGVETNLDGVTIVECRQWLCVQDGLA